MRIACAVNPGDLAAGTFDLAVLSERVNEAEFLNLSKRNPQAVIAGAVRDGRHCRGIILRNGKRFAEYLKILGDMQSVGSQDDNQCPVHHFNDMSVAVIVCRDIDHLPFLDPVLRELNARTDTPRLLCIPADMGKQWFQEDVLPGAQRYAGLWVALSNSTASYPAKPLRCASFITDKAGKKVTKQDYDEPIFFDSTPEP